MSTLKRSLRSKNKYTPNPPLSTVNKYIILPMINNYNNLEIFTLYCPHWNVFQHNNNLIQLLTKKMPYLKELSIHSLITNNIYSKSHNNYFIGLQTLNVSFQDPSINHDQFQSNITNILSELFCTFVGINKFEFDYHSQINLSINWKEMFLILFKNKNLYSMKNVNKHLQPLKSVSFKSVKHQPTKNIFKHIIHLKDEVYFDLTDFAIDLFYSQGNVSWRNVSKDKKEQIEKIINEQIVPFLKSFNQNGNLRNLNLSFENWYLNLYVGPFIYLLQSFPKSMNSITISFPVYSDWPKGLYVNKRVESMKLVSCLTKILSEKTSESTLKSVILNGFKIPPKPTDFLTFFFGYNNKIFIEKNK
eukprot:329141_1